MKRVPLPITIKIPLVVIVFMAAVAVFVSERVLSRLASIQTGHLGSMATVYLDGLELALTQPVVREDVWEVFDILDRARRNHGGMQPTETVVATSAGEVLASSDPRTTPSLSSVPASFPTRDAGSPKLVVKESEGRAFARRDLKAGGAEIGFVHAAFDIAPLLAERRSVLVTLVGTNAVLTLALTFAAWLTVRRMVRPVRILGEHLEAGTRGMVEPIPSVVVEREGTEFQRLFAAFNTMAEAVRQQENLTRQLAEEERLASLGRLASGMAHEINNPLGGIFNAIDTLKQHSDRPEVRHRSIDLIERGLRGIRDVVRTTLVTYRADPDGRSLTPADIDDLLLLIGPEVHRRGVAVSWTNTVEIEAPVRASPVRQILLNLLLNACRASPLGSRIALHARIGPQGLTIDIEDGGPGLPADAARVLAGQGGAPGSVGAGRGLGLWMVRRLLKDVGGQITVSGGDEFGTTVRVTIPLQAREVLADAA